MGHVLTAGLGQNPARQASIHAGSSSIKTCPYYKSSMWIWIKIYSFRISINQIREKIILLLQVVKKICLGHLTHCSYRENKKLDETKLLDTMINDGLIDSFNNYHMGVTAENVAEKFKISRDEQDIFALNSQEKTQEANK